MEKAKHGRNAKMSRASAALLGSDHWLRVRELNDNEQQRREVEDQSRDVIAGVDGGIEGISGIMSFEELEEEVSQWPDLQERRRTEPVWSEELGGQPAEGGSPGQSNQQGNALP